VGETHGHSALEPPNAGSVSGPALPGKLPVGLSMYGRVRERHGSDTRAFIGVFPNISLALWCARVWEALLATAKGH
jgi:hypothetical protein